MTRGGKRLGRQAPAVLAAPRQAPGVLTKPVTDAGIRAAEMARTVELVKLRGELDAVRADLGAALDGWEAVASTSDQVRIDALRRRWGLASESAEPADGAVDGSP